MKVMMVKMSKLTTLYCVFEKHFSCIDGRRLAAFPGLKVKRHFGLLHRDVTVVKIRV